MLNKIAFMLVALVLATLIPSIGFAADEVVGHAVAGQINFQDAASPVMEKIHSFHGFMLYIIIPIVVLVFGLLFYVMLRFNERANPKPATFTHHWGLEIAWTIVPAVIVLFIAIKSMQLLYFENHPPEADLNIKVTGYQWYWGYEYPDNGDLNFMAYMVKDKEIDPSKGQIRLLSTDNPVVVPVNKVVHLQITASDVIHSFAIPAFGVKTDAMPGRLNEAWFKATKTGTFYGQCSEICGTGHAFMPIEIKVVTDAEFAAWVHEKGGKLAEEIKAEADAAKAAEEAAKAAAAAAAPTPAVATAAAPATPAGAEAPAATPTPAAAVATDAATGAAKTAAPAPETPATAH